MQDLIIQPQEEKKGRSFQATCVALITADQLYPEGGGETIRPVWAMFAGSEAELRPFMANLKLGRKAETPSGYRRHGNSERVEFLKSIGYYISWQREPEGTIATIYHPDLFRLDPGMVDPEGIGFVMLVPSDWASQQKVDAGPVVDYVRTFGYQLDEATLQALVPTAYLFAAYLDRRTRCPLVADGRFYLQILCAALNGKLASFPGDNVRWPATHRDDWGHNRHLGFNAVVGGLNPGPYDPGLEAVNLRHAIAFKASHETFESFLSEQVSIFFDRTEGHDFVSLSQRIDLSSFSEAC